MVCIYVLHTFKCALILDISLTISVWFFVKQRLDDDDSFDTSSAKESDSHLENKISGKGRDLFSYLLLAL